MGAVPGGCTALVLELLAGPAEPGPVHPDVYGPDRHLAAPDRSDEGTVHLSKILFLH